MSLVIVAFGIVGNLFTIKVLLHPNMKTAIDIHFIGLAIADLVSLVLILFIIPLRYILVSHKMLWYHEFHTIIFPLLYPVTIAFQLNSIFITVAASICRCITVYCPGLSQKMFTIKKSVKIIVVIFVFDFILSIPYWLKYRTKKEINPYSQMVEFHLVETNFSNSINKFHIFLTTSSYSIPLLILLIVNTLLIVVLLKARKRKQYFGLTHSNEIKITMILILIIITFFLCHMPNFILNILIYFCNKSQKDIYMIHLHHWSNFLLIVNYSCNFAIYCVFGEKFRSTAALLCQARRIDNIPDDEVVTKNRSQK